MSGCTIPEPARIPTHDPDKEDPMASRCVPTRSPLLALLLVAAASGCTTVPATADRDDSQNDPLESFNRRVFAVNTALDRAVIKPVAKAYRAALPDAVRDRIRAVIDNLHEPMVFANDLLQGRGEAAGITGRRFIINSTVGLGGLFDKAGEWGMPKQSGDFGQTLYAWGVEDGPYLMLPFFGPSNVRDLAGLGVDSYTSPVAHVGSTGVRSEVGLSVGFTDGIDLRSRNIESLDAMESGSVDFYAYLRSVSRQHRQSALNEARGVKPDTDLEDPGVEVPAPVGPKPPAR